MTFSLFHRWPSLSRGLDRGSHGTRLRPRRRAMSLTRLEDLEGRQLLSGGIGTAQTVGPQAALAIVEGLSPANGALRAAALPTAVQVANAIGGVARGELINALKKYIVDFFSETPEEDYNYCRIVNEKQFDRLLGYLSGATIETGGRHDRSKLFIAPTILTGISPESPVMREEIFGPLLPVISFRTFEEARTVIAQHPNPLAFYLFTASRSREKAWLQAVPFGGGCVNNCSWHFTNHELPFGGRGASGTGSYHGRYSFETFSHRKGVLKTPAWFDPALRYPPFQGKLKWFKRLIR